MKRLLIPLFILFVLTALGFTFFRSYSELPFKSLDKEGVFEVREYAPMVVAETVIPGERQTALHQGIRILDGYISGGNSKGEKISVIPPVTEQLSKKGWAIRYILPQEKAAADFPKPDNSRVELKWIGKRRYAVIRFSGQADNLTIQEKLIELMDFVVAKKLVARNETIIALYDPSWVPGFLRRNELLLQLDYNP